MSKITIVEAPNLIEDQENTLTLFLGGGITNCPDWQAEVINFLFKNWKSDKDLIIFNPRRKFFNISNKDESYNQIKWEFDHINKCDVFSLYFSETEKSDQPICFYELGRNLILKDKIIIGVHLNCRRYTDVVYQTELASKGNLIKVNSINEYCEYLLKTLLTYC